MGKQNKNILSEEEKKPVNRESIKKLLGIFHFVLPYKSYLISGLIALLFSSALLLSFPFLSGQLLDVASGKEGVYFDTVNQIALSLMAILLLQSIFSFVRVYTFSIVSERSMSDIRQAVFKKFIWQNMEFFDRQRVGEMLSRITSDIGMLQDAISISLAELIRQVITLLVGTALVFYFVPTLTLFMLITFPILVLLALFFGKYIRKLSKRAQDSIAESNVIAEESLHAIQVVKSFTNENFEIHRYGQALKEGVRLALRSSGYRGLFISFVIFALIGGMVAVVWYGATLIQEGSITQGELFSFVLYTGFIGGSLAGLGDIYSQMQRSIGASERVLEILNREDEEDHSDGALNLKGDVVFEKVSFAYPTRPEAMVLNNFDITVKSGQKVALVGPSGSGKSTIIHLLIRNYPVHSGRIVVDGKDITEYSRSSYRKNFGIVPQEVILFGGTIRENIAYGNPNASFEEIVEAARKANVLGFVETFPDRFETRVGDRGIKLSGGQRQRIAIARAILRDPAILILDEATSALDSHSEKAVQEALENLMQGRTVIIIAHRLSTIKGADRIFVIQQGELKEAGVFEDLMKREGGYYKKMWEIQGQGSENDVLVENSKLVFQGDIKS